MPGQELRYYIVANCRALAVTLTVLALGSAAYQFATLTLVFVLVMSAIIGRGLQKTSLPLAMIPRHIMLDRWCAALAIPVLCFPFVPWIGVAMCAAIFVVNVAMVLRRKTVPLPMPIKACLPAFVLTLVAIITLRVNEGGWTSEFFVLSLVIAAVGFVTAKPMPSLHTYASAVHTQ